MRQQFWTTFGQYMSPVLSAEGEKVNWVNYKTSEKSIGFCMDADNKKAYIGIEITHKDTGIQQLYFEQFMELKNAFEDVAGKDWQWRLLANDDNGRMISKIYKEQEGVSIFKKENWPALIQFFKHNITALDLFWSNAKWGFESLR